jgi:hypothetical protein
MAVHITYPFEEAPLNALARPSVLLTCKPGVVAAAAPGDVEAGLPASKVVVQEDVVATGEAATPTEPEGMMPYDVVQAGAMSGRA